MRFWLAVAALLAPAVAAAQTPVIADGGIVNAASAVRGGPVAPGSLISIFGTDLASTLASADSVPLSTSLGDVTSVNVNGVAVPLVFVSGRQINAQVPWEVGPGAASVVVSRGGTSSDARTVQVNSFAPAIFYFASPGGRLLAFAQNSDSSTLAQASGSIPGATSQPAARGSTIIIYATGLGPVDTAVATGDKAGAVQSNTTTKPTVLIGGVEAQVLFSGLSPDFVGVNQINVVVPANAPAGNAVPLQIRMGDVTTPDPVVIAIAN